MRYVFKIKILPILGQTRIKEKFLIFPKKIKNEIRWLEKARWEEVFKDIYKGFPYYYWKKKWVANKWLLNDSEANN